MDHEDEEVLPLSGSNMMEHVIVIDDDILSDPDFLFL